MINCRGRDTTLDAALSMGTRRWQRSFRAISVNSGHCFVSIVFVTLCGQNICQRVRYVRYTRYIATDVPYFVLRCETRWSVRRTNRGNSSRVGSRCFGVIPYSPSLRSNRKRILSVEIQMRVLRVKSTRLQ